MCRVYIHADGQADRRAYIQTPGCSEFQAADVAVFHVYPFVVTI